MSWKKQKKKKKKSVKLWWIYNCCKNKPLSNRKLIFCKTKASTSGCTISITISFERKNKTQKMEFRVWFSRDLGYFNVARISITPKYGNNGKVVSDRKTSVINCGSDLYKRCLEHKWKIVFTVVSYILSRLIFLYGFVILFSICN